MAGIEYPATRKAASHAARSARKRHFGLLGAHLTLLVLVAVAAVWSPDDANWAKVAAFLMFCAVVASLLIKALRFGERWFECRAVAENIKSLTWQFAMAPPSGEGEAQFLADLGAIRDRFPASAKDMAEFVESDGVEIPQRIKELKRSTIVERRTVFLEERLRDQMRYYASKAKANRKKERLWFVVITLVEIVALGIAILRVSDLGIEEVTGAVAALAAAFVAWTQASRHGELATTYMSAHADLIALAQRAETVRTEQVLADLVEDGETAISREHSMWLSSRGKPL